MNCKTKWAAYWEVHEYPVDWEKAEEIEKVFDQFRDIVSNAGLRLRVPPHVIIRLSQGPIPMEEIVALAAAAVDKMVYGKLRSGCVEVPAALDRGEIHLNGNFVVFKEWIGENRQIDLISIGVCGPFRGVSL